ncbi:MAG TPA: ATP-binding protein [Melioribacteraceae bacterium]|nr:ATP-binding protein [Melioribacteraceae bacterium]
MKKTDNYKLNNSWTISLYRGFISHSKNIWTAPLSKYFLSALIISISGFTLNLISPHVGYQSISLIFLFIVSLLPLLKFKPGPIFLAAVMSALIWNFYFIPPYYTFRIGKVEDGMMFIMYFVIATVSGLLISRIRTQQVLINQKERRTSALYNLTRDLSSSRSLDEVTAYAINHLKSTFHAEVVFIYSGNEKYLNDRAHNSSTFIIDDAERNIAQIALLSSEKVGKFTRNVSSISPITYLPLFTTNRNYGVAGLLFPEGYTIEPDVESLLDTFIAQISAAVEREYLTDLAKNNLIIAESEKLYKTLFDSISHELKTPITTIIGAISSLKDDKIFSNKKIITQLIDEAGIASERLKRLVENLLDITRLERGNLKLKQEWHSISDLINSSISRVETESQSRKINCDIGEEIGMLNFDYPLLEQALINILHNSIEYTSSECKIDVTAKRKSDLLIITISDNGMGFPENEIKNLFTKFYRIPGTKAGGTGLGLSIAKGFIEAHGGTIKAQNRPGGGAEFIISLPINS